MTREKRRNGFTLIELVVSALLTSIMMGTLLSVLWSSLRLGTSLDQDRVNQFPMTLVAEQLRTDFQNAQSYRIDQGAVLISGFIGRDSQTGLRNLTSDVVRYEALRIGNHAALVRRSMTQRGAGSEVVRLGVLGIQFQSLVESSDSNSIVSVQAGFRPMPSQFRLSVFSTGGKVLFREVVHHHAD